MAIFGLREVFGVPTAPSWRRFAARLVLATDERNQIGREQLDELLRATTGGAMANETRAVLSELRIIRKAENGFEVDHASSVRIAMALEVLDTEEPQESDGSWKIVATLPYEIGRKWLPEGVSSTKACVLSLIEEAKAELWLASPYMDMLAIQFLHGPISTALENGAAVKILTAECNAEFIAELIQAIRASASVSRLTVWEAPTISSLLGTHAKAIVSDGSRAYLGSANLTGYGLDKHFELGVRVSGRQVPDIAMILKAIADEGAEMFSGEATSV